MTPANQRVQVIGHPALNELPAHLGDRLQAEIVFRHYELGQSLSLDQQLPSELLLIMEGSARLVARDQGHLLTVEKLGPGSWVGLASFLRTGGCEEVSAAGPLVAAAIPDTLAIDLIGDSSFYRKACGGVLGAELAALLQCLLGKGPGETLGLKVILEQAKTLASIASPGTNQPQQQVYLASCNGTNLDY